MTVTVGFAAAATPGLITGGDTAAPEEAAPDGLFAALLALLVPQPTPESETPATALAETAVPRQAAVLPETATVTPLIAINDRPPMQTEQGKSLLKTLSDALIAINDALDAGKPVDPALHNKLSDALDAVAVYLGTFAPPAPQIDPRITALASGDGVIPSVVDTAPAPAPAPATPPAAAAPATDVPETAATSGTTQPASPTTQPAPDANLPELPETFAKLVADVAPDAAAPETAGPEATTPEPTPSSGATTLEQAPPALRQLGLYIGKLSEKLAAQDPDLAKKLDALATTLKSGTLPEDLKAALGLDQAVTERELKRIIEALATPKPDAAKPVAAKPFTAPTLELPQAVTAPTKQAEPATTVAAAPEPAPTPKLEASEPEIARPVTAATTPKTEKPEAGDSKPAAAPAQASQPQSTPVDAAAANTPATQPAAVPVARAVHAAYQTPLQQVNLPQVAFEVVRQFEAGNTRFQIRLDPPELGRIDVKLDVDKSGAVNARLTVERPETLDLMQRDQRALQQALQQAGLDGSKTNLEFSLRQNPFAQQGGMGDGRGDHQSFNGRGDSFAGGDDVGAETATTTYRGTASASGLNLFV
ncbi:flagellar hook-length control protein FliK [Devosia sp. LjRoot16]|uniref:flagellar hook-length control protein FliK n=1 Tax=Devosia sp. LjRoot16 TaxID=3342271 RepID=UPI003ECC66BA